MVEREETQRLPVIGQQHGDKKDKYATFKQIADVSGVRLVHVYLFLEQGRALRTPHLAPRLNRAIAYVDGRKGSNR